MVSLILTSVIFAFGQEQTPLNTPASDSQIDSDTQWLWGEVVYVDNQKNMLLVKYLDYDTDQEKEMLFSMDDKTAFENVKSSNEIKPRDAVSVDYVLTAGGLILAKKVSIEKPEDMDTPEAAPGSLVVTPGKTGK